MNVVSLVNLVNGEEYWFVFYEVISGLIIMFLIKFGDYLYVVGYLSKSLFLKFDVDKFVVEEVWWDKFCSVILFVNV